MSESLLTLLDEITKEQVKASSRSGALLVASDAAGAKTDAAVTDPTASGSNIALLKGILTRLSTLSGYVDQLEGYSDGLETLLTTLGGYVDGIETLMTTLGGYQDGVETLLTAIKSTDGIKKITDNVNTVITGDTIDAATKAIRNINTDHAYIHSGIAFKFSLDIGALAAAASESYSFKTPAGKYLHLKNLRIAALGAGVRVDLIRGTTGNPLTIDSAGGAAGELVGPNNLNDNVATASGVTIMKTPTYVGGADGEVWMNVQADGSSTNQFITVVDSQINENEELVLKPDTYYVITITNLSGGGGDNADQVLVTGFYYEELLGS